MRQRLAIIGASDLGVQIGHHATASGAFELVGYYDNYHTTPDAGAYLGTTESLAHDHGRKVFDCILIGIGWTNFTYRVHFFDQCISLGIPVPALIHPSAHVDASATIGRGVIVLPGCVVDRNVVLEDNVFLNLSCTVAHDSRIGAHSFLAPGACVAGCVTIGERNFVGANATIIHDLSIAAGSIIGAGAVMVKSVPTAGTYVGNPGRRRGE